LTSRRGTRYQWLVRLAAIVVLLAVTAPAVVLAQDAAAPKAAAAPARKERERRAESAFVAGRYQEAADLLNGLYSEFHNPVYLRNLGRCEQRLKDPDRAIAAFDEYLRRGKGITPAERDEVRGFIREMEDLKKQQEAAAAPPPRPPVVAPAVATPPPPVMTAPPPALSPAMTASPAAEVTTAPPAATSGHGKLIGGVLLGAAAALAAGGGVILSSSWSKFHAGEKIGCPGVYDCSKYADKVESQALVSKILFGAAAAAGIAGGTVLVLSFGKDSSSASSGLNIALGGKF
jgi:hypothetical protein